ncbi:helix-turn-helix domain-containing protein [Haploplasma modicum]|nr:helix-turn-helix domain-containing protein [Haploplasma modicum]
MKLNLKDKLDIIDLYKEGMPQSLIAIKYNVSELTIWILTRQYREH